LRIFLDERKKLKEASAKRLHPSNKDAKTLCRCIDEICEKMQLPERAAVMATIAKIGGVNPITVNRIYTGKQAFCNSRVLAAGAQLVEIIRAEKVPTLLAGTKEVVPHHYFQAAIGKLEKWGLYDHKKLVLVLQQRHSFTMNDNRLQRIYQERTKFRWVDAAIYRDVEALVTNAKYDTYHSYQVGQRLHHHLFGPGTVTGKIHRDKICVMFDNGETYTLAEKHQHSEGWQRILDPFDTI